MQYRHTKIKKSENTIKYIQTQVGSNTVLVCNICLHWVETEHSILPHFLDIFIYLRIVAGRHDFNIEIFWWKTLYFSTRLITLILFWCSYLWGTSNTSSIHYSSPQISYITAWTLSNPHSCLTKHKLLLVPPKPKLFVNTTSMRLDCVSLAA